MARSEAVGSSAERTLEDPLMWSNRRRWRDRTASAETSTICAPV